MESIIGHEFYLVNCQGLDFPIPFVEINHEKSEGSERINLSSFEEYSSTKVSFDLKRQEVWIDGAYETNGIWNSWYIPFSSVRKITMCKNALAFEIVTRSTVCDALVIETNKIIVPFWLVEIGRDSVWDELTDALSDYIKFEQSSDSYFFYHE